MNKKEFYEKHRTRLDSLTSTEELIELVESEGIELTEEQLDAVSGGTNWLGAPDCPNCGSSNVGIDDPDFNTFICHDCKNGFSG